MRLLKKFKQASLALLVVCSTACVSMETHREKHPEPSDRLDQMLELYAQADFRGNECLEIWRADNATIDCERVLREVERLYLEFPNNERILMTNATLNFSAGRLSKAQFLLDELLAKPGVHPEAGILRSRIALKEGNTRLATRTLDQQIMLAPDNFALREAQAANYFFAEDYPQTKRYLSMAGRLGAPGWRIAYHLGLMAEKQEEWAQACHYYSGALEQNPGHKQTAARLIGLSEYPECRQVFAM